MQPHFLIDRLASYFSLSDQLLKLFFNLVVVCLSTLFQTQVPLKVVFLSLSLTSCRSPKEKIVNLITISDVALPSLLQGAESNHGCALPAFVK